MKLQVINYCYRWSALWSCAGLAVRSCELTRADPQSLSLRRCERSPRMTVSPAGSGGGGVQYWGPSQTFISKVGGYKYVTDQYTALLSSIWGREDHLEHRRRDRMVRFLGETDSRHQQVNRRGTWSLRTPTRRRRLFKTPLLKYGPSDSFILFLIFYHGRTQETINTFTCQ